MVGGQVVLATSKEADMGTGFVKFVWPNGFVWISEEPALGLIVEEMKKRPDAVGVIDEGVQKATGG